MIPMRASEILCIAFFGVFLVATVGLPGADRRRRAIGVGITGIGIVLLLPLLGRLPGGRILRDLLPGFILLMTYWQSGAFVTAGGGTRTQELLARVDRRVLPDLPRIRGWIAERPWVSLYFEGAYLICYPTVPLGVAALYLLGQGSRVDAFWLVVLPAVFLCQALTTVFQSWPPWLAYPDETPTRRSTKLRRMNQWVTDHASIRANTFPSGHVACSYAVGLFLLTIASGAGALFLVIATSTAVATVLLGYHYVPDVILGVLVAFASLALFG